LETEQDDSSSSSPPTRMLQTHQTQTDGAQFFFLIQFFLPSQIELVQTKHRFNTFKHKNITKNAAKLITPIIPSSESRIIVFLLNFAEKILQLGEEEESGAVMGNGSGEGVFFVLNCLF
jgi:hypothetical protein